MLPTEFVIDGRPDYVPESDWRVVVDVCYQKNVNPYLIAAIGKHETQWQPYWRGKRTGYYWGYALGYGYPSEAGRIPKWAGIRNQVVGACGDIKRFGRLFWEEADAIEFARVEWRPANPTAWGRSVYRIFDQAMGRYRPSGKVPAPAAVAAAEVVPLPTPGAPPLRLLETAKAAGSAALSILKGVLIFLAVEVATFYAQRALTAVERRMIRYVGRLFEQHNEHVVKPIVTSLNSAWSYLVEATGVLATHASDIFGIRHHIHFFIEPWITALSNTVDRVRLHIHAVIEPWITSLSNTLDRARLHIHRVIEPAIEGIRYHIHRVIEPWLARIQLSVDTLYKHLSSVIEPWLFRHDASLSTIFSHFERVVNPAVRWVYDVGLSLQTLLYDYVLPNVKNFERVIPKITSDITRLYERVLELPQDLLGKVYERVISDTKAAPFETVREILDSMVEAYTASDVARIEAVDFFSEAVEEKKSAQALPAGAEPPIFALLGITYGGILKGIGERMIDP